MLYYTKQNSGCQLSETLFQLCSKFHLLKNLSKRKVTFLDAHAFQAPGLSLTQSVSQSQRWSFANLTILNCGHVSDNTPVYLNYISTISQPYLSHISAVSQPYLSHISTISQPYLNQISTIS